MIYLLRHGQTVFNAEGRLQGHVDSPLTELGVAQARRMGEALKSLVSETEGWRILSSPLGRARATADLVSEVLGWGEVEVEDRLKELTAGRWDGMLRTDIQKEHPEAFSTSGWDFRAPGAETFEAVADRMAEWLGTLHADCRIIAISHGISGRVLRGVYAGLSRDVALAQPVPQDAFFRLSAGAIERVDCAPL